MDLDLSADQEEMVAAFRTFFVRECPPAVVRDAEPDGFDRRVWTTFLSMGGPTIGVAEVHGGGGASLLDLELIAEPAGATLAPIPLVETLVAARLLTADGIGGGGDVDPEAITTLALRPAVDGAARLVPAGAVADAVVGLDGDDLVVVTEPAPGGVPGNLGCLPLADRGLRGASRRVLASGADAHRAHTAALDEWRSLTAGALVGLAGAALDIGVEYAKDRQQFGRAIGSFQSIARDLADAATLVDGARLLVRETAWAADEGEPEASALARMALMFSARAAQKATAVALHVHGGYGFTLEYDIQLYYRRAKAWPLVLEDQRVGAQRAADALFGPIGAH